MMDKFTDLARTVTLEFRNGKKLEIGGVYLWKFLDSIPPELDSDDHGWNDENAYSELNSELLMNCIRTAYANMFELKPPGDIDLVSPLGATIILGNSPTVETVFPSALHDETLWQPLKALITAHLPDAKHHFRSKLKESFDATLAEGQTTLEHEDRGNGMIGRRVATSAWPENTRHNMTLKEFWMVLRQDKAVPWLTSNITYCTRDIQEIALSSIQQIMLDLQIDNPVLYVAIAEGWRIKCTAKAGFKKEVLRKALAESRDHEKIINIFWNYFFPEDSDSTPVLQYLGEV